MWSTLHVSLYCKALCITTTGDWKRGKEKRGIYKCSVVFNASYKKKPLEVLLFYAIARYLAEPKLGKGHFNKSLGSRKLVREINQTNCKNCKKYFKHVLPLFHIVRKNPLKKLEHYVDSHDDIKIFLLKIIDRRTANSSMDVLKDNYA